MINSPERCVVIGTSAGGVDALKTILPYFKRPSKLTVALVIHLPPTGPNLIPTLFESSCDFRIKEAESGEPMEAETIYVAPPDYHLSIESNMTMSLSTEAPLNYSRPSIDILFDSAACSLRDRVMGILMTGANQDGARGLFKIHKEGGKTIIQDPEEAEYPTMPESVLEYFRPDEIINVTDMEMVISEYQREIFL